MIAHEGTGTEVLELPTKVPCYTCFGTGWVPRDPDIGTDQECFVCDGSGFVEAE